MRVAVAYEAGQAARGRGRLDVPTVGPRDVLVRVAASGICHTDLNVVERVVRAAVPDRRRATRAAAPWRRSGPEVRRVTVGDRVLASVSPACGSCWWCLNGMSNHCEKGPVVRTTPRYHARRRPATAAALCGCGTFGEAMVVDEASVVAVETDLPDEELALLGCGVTTGLGAALNTAGVIPGSSVAVIGCGGVGQSVIQGARIAGAVHDRRDRPRRRRAGRPASARRDAHASTRPPPTRSTQVHGADPGPRRRLHLRGRRTSRS